MLVYPVPHAVTQARVQLVADQAERAPSHVIRQDVLNVSAAKNEAVRQALADILLVTPQDLKSHVDRVARAAAARHGFLGHRAYVARVGRGRQIELFFIVPQGAPARTRHSTASRNSRLSSPVPPGSVGLPGSSGATFSQAVSPTTNRFRSSTPRPPPVRSLNHERRAVRTPTVNRP